MLLVRLRNVFASLYADTAILTKYMNINRRRLIYNVFAEFVRIKKKKKKRDRNK